MAKTESVLFKLGLDVAGLTKGARDGRKGLEDLEKGSNNLIGTLGRLAAVTGLGLGFGKLASEALQFGDQMTKLSQQTGMTTDQLQRWDFIAKQTGTTVDTFTNAIGKMQEQLVKAADGSEKQAEAFALLNINTETFFRLDPDAQFRQVAESIASIANPADRTAAAIAAFGKGGKEMLPTIIELADKGEALAAEFDKLGGPLSEETIKALDDIGDSASKTGVAAKNLVAELLAFAAPAVLTALDTITAFFAGLRIAASGGDDEIANLTGTIDSLQTHLDYMRKTNPFPDAFGKSQIEELVTRIETLKAKQQELIDLPYKEALAAREALRMKQEVQAEELADIVVHGEAKTALELDQRAKREYAFYEQQIAFNEGTVKMIEDHEAQVTDITNKSITDRIAFQTMTLDQQVSTIAGKLQAMTAATAQHSKTMFAINKAASLAKATVDGYEAVMASYKFGAGIGGPYVGAAFAAVAAAAAASNIAAIAKTQFNGGGAGLAPSQATQPNVPVTQQGGGQGGGGANAGGVLNVTGVNPASMFDGKTVRGLAERISEYVKDGGTVRFE
jgi:hypothetical protein